MCDFGYYWTSHHPWIVPEPFTLEPTESYSKEELDEYVEALEEIAREAYENPEIEKSSPPECCTRLPRTGLMILISGRLPGSYLKKTERVTRVNPETYRTVNNVSMFLKR